MAKNFPNKLLGLFGCIAVLVTFAGLAASASTRMPSFSDALTVEQRWAITDFIFSLSGSNGPGYTNIVIAKHAAAQIDLAKGAANFASAPVARLPIIGQIMEPGRAFHPPATSVMVQAIYDADSIALLVRWHDMSAEKTGKNGPSLPVPPAEEEEPAIGAAGEGGAAGANPFGDELAPAGQGQKPATPQNPFEDQSETAAPPSEFSDAVAIQFPSEVPASARKPYFIFGDAQDSVDLWFFDLAGPNPLRFTAKGSADIAPNDKAEVTGVANYDQGEWSVIFKRPLRPTSGAMGGFTGRTHGSTTLTATYEGRSVSKTVQVVNNYAGTWEGRYVVKACTDSGDLTDHDGGWCLAGPGRVGTVYAITMTLVQSGKDLQEITRTFGHNRDTISGQVTADGRLVLAGTLPERDFDYAEVVIGTVEFSSWDTGLDAAGGMTGGWSEYSTSYTGRRGTSHTVNELVTMTRVSR